MMIYSDKWRSMLVSEAGKMGVNISLKQAKLLCIHADELIAVNKKFNLTTITDPVAVLEKHIIDSLVAATHIKKGSSLIDIGTGGGFPGIPIKILRPDTDITLLDSSRKKVSFLNYLIGRLGLANIKAVHGRMEDKAYEDRYHKAYDLAISRAFASLCQFVKSACPFISEKGYLIAMKGPAVDPEINELLSVPQLEGPWGQTSILPSDIQTISYRLPLTDSRRVLVIVRVRK